MRGDAGGLAEATVGVDAGLVASGLAMAGGLAMVAGLATAGGFAAAAGFAGGIGDDLFAAASTGFDGLRFDGEDAGATLPEAGAPALAPDFAGGFATAAAGVFGGDFFAEPVARPPEDRPLPFAFAIAVRFLVPKPVCEGSPVARGPIMLLMVCLPDVNPAGPTLAAAWPAMVRSGADI